MTTVELISMIKEVGLSAGILWLLIWMVQYFARAMTKGMDALTKRIEISTDKARGEHDQIKDELRMRSNEHKEFALQQKEITATLGRINGFKK